jgi:serine/threonine protein kinase
VGRQLEHEAHVMHMLSGHRLDVIQQQQQEEEEMEEEEEEIECIQMQLCSGPPLNEFIRTLQRELTVQELVLVLWDMLLGIQHIHENNIVHSKSITSHLCEECSSHSV